MDLKSILEDILPRAQNIISDIKVLCVKHLRRQ